MRIYFYLSNNTINDATQYFINLMENAFLNSGFEVIVCYNQDFKISENDYIFVTTIKDFMNIFLKNRNAKTIYWSQGLLSEEHIMTSKKTILNRIKAKVYNFLEGVTLNKSFYTIYVSDFMMTYLSDKHSFESENYSIIPCYNKQLKEVFFNSALKRKMSFVYAGGLFSWQCFPETVSIYKEIEDKDDNAFFTVLTKDIEVANRLLKNANVRNYNVLYVDLKDLDEELSKHKYGFMLRENNIVNSCATPTKMNSYMAVGLIPIYTNAIKAFNTHLNLSPYEVKIDLKNDFNTIAKEIIEHDNRNVDYQEYYKICEKNFKGFYDDDYSIDIIKTQLIGKISPN